MFAFFKGLRFKDRWAGALPLVVVCGVLFLGLLVVLMEVERPVKVEREIERRREAGVSISPTQYVPVWLYKGLQVNVVVAGLLLVGSPWLGRRRPEGVVLLARPEMGGGGWRVWVCVGLMGVVAWHHAPRLFHSMWGDEEFNASRFILPDVQRQEDGSLEIKERSWKTTLWSMRKPTNHLGYSVFARLSHDAFFEAGEGPKDAFFSEALLRAPVYVAGVLMIPACVWALGVWGVSGWWAVLLLMLHPWYLRFGVDGRAYGMMMLSSFLVMGCLGRALQTGYWRWWLGLSWLGFFVLWGNLQGLYSLVALHGAVLVYLLVGGLGWEARWFLARRWVVCGVLTGMLMVGYLAPCLPQLIEYLARHEIKGYWDWAFVKDVLSGWWFGQQWVTWLQPENPLRFGMDMALVGVPWLRWGGVGLWMGLLLLGVGLLLREWRSRWVLLVFVLGGPVVMVTHMLVSESRPYDWYFSPFVPGLVMLVGVAGCWLGRRRWGAVVMLGMVVVYGLMTHGARKSLRHHGVEASRESVASYREVTNPRHADIEKEVISGGFVMFTEGYDSAMWRFYDVAGLRDLMRRADESGRGLFINVGNLDFVRGAEGTREITAVLEDEGLFEKTGEFYGLMPFTTRSVFRYKGGNGR